MIRRLVVPGMLFALVASATTAATYPDRPIRVIAAQSAGSSLDTIGRIVVPKLSDMLGQQIDGETEEMRKKRIAELQQKQMLGPAGSMAVHSRSLPARSNRGASPT